MPPEFDQHTDWQVLPLLQERMVTGSNETVSIPAPLTIQRTNVDSGGRQQALFYGWPLVVVHQQSRKNLPATLRCAPLMVVEVEVDDTDLCELVAVADPILNSALLVEDFFEPDAIATVRDLESAGLRDNAEGGLAGQLELVCEYLGLPDAALDADRLAPSSVRGVRGVYNVAAVYSTGVDASNVGLLEDLAQLEEREDWHGTAARHLVNPAESTKWEEHVVPAALVLNDSQEQALIATAVAPATVITGPPGTGKSQLVAAIVAAAWLRAESVLVASTNNEAVEVAVRRASDVDDGLLIRTGNLSYREKLPDLLRDLAARPDNAGGSIHVAQRRLALAGDRRQAIMAALQERSEAESELARLTIDVEVVRSLLWGSAERSPVHDARARIGQRARRLARARWFVEGRTRRLLETAQALPGRGADVDDLVAWATKQDRCERLHGWIEEAEAAGVTPASLNERMEAADSEWKSASVAVVRPVVSARLAKGRVALEHFADLRRGGRAARLTAMSRLLTTASGWACTAQSAAPNFPLTPGLFDLLIIDEASQCRIADVLPLAYRAKRIVVVGDPQQLTPVVKLGKPAMEAAARAVGATEALMHGAALSYGSDSAFTAFAAWTSSDTFLLDEHYRCHPDIASFVNEHFYGGRLTVLTDVAHLRGTLRGAHWDHIEGRTERGPKGGALNLIEARAVVQWIIDHRDEPGSIGVVTPFSAQSALIERLLAAELDDDSRRAIMVGTAHKFQGGERDVIVFSPVLSVDAHRRTAEWVQEQSNLVNVAVSRARSALVVIGDKNAAERVPILAALHRATLEPPVPVSIVHPRENPALHSESERRLYEALLRAGYAVDLKPLVEGFELDFAVSDGTSRWLNVECDGSQHTDVRGRQRRQDVKRDMILKSLGWTVVRVPAWRCLAEPDLVVTELAHVFSQLPEVPVD